MCTLYQSFQEGAGPSTGGLMDRTKDAAGRQAGVAAGDASLLRPCHRHMSATERLRKVIQELVDTEKSYVKVRPPLFPISCLSHPLAVGFDLFPPRGAPIWAARGGRGRLVNQSNENIPSDTTEGGADLVAGQVVVTYRCFILHHCSIFHLFLQDLSCLFEIYLKPLQNETFLTQDEVGVGAPEHDKARPRSCRGYGRIECAVYYPQTTLMKYYRPYLPHYYRRTN